SASMASIKASLSPRASQVASSKWCRFFTAASVNTPSEKRAQSATRARPRSESRAIGRFTVSPIVNLLLLRLNAPQEIFRRPLGAFGSFRAPFYPVGRILHQYVSRRAVAGLFEHDRRISVARRAARTPSRGLSGGVRIRIR